MRTSAERDWREWRGADELRRHYAGVRKRVFGAKPKPFVLRPSPPLEPPPEPVVDLLEGAPRLPWLLARVALRLVCEATGIRGVQVLSDSRRPHFVEARCMCFAICEDGGMSLPNIGRQFNRDHTTVLSGLRKVERLRAADPWYNARIARLIAAARAAVQNTAEEDNRWRTVAEELATTSRLQARR